MTSVLQRQTTSIQQDTPTETQSLIMIRNLFRTAISSISYIRGLFPEDCFGDRILTGVPIKTLQAKTDESTMLCRWLEEGVFEAINKKYLKAMVFGVYVDENFPTTMTECYNFNVSYPENGSVDLSIAESSCSKKAKQQAKRNQQSLSLTSKEDIKKATIQLLRTLISITQTLKPLPDQRSLTMKLFYYEEKTPKEYQPKFFQDCQQELTFNQKPLKLRVGTVGTPYHMIQLKVGTTLDAMNEDEPSSQVQHRLDNMKWALDDEEEEEKENQNDKENPENETVENEGEEDSVQNETANANDSDQSNNNNGIHTPNDEMDESQQRDQNEKRQNSKKATTSRNEPSEQQIEGFVLSVSEFTYSSIKQQFPSLKSSTLKVILQKMISEGQITKKANQSNDQNTTIFVPIPQAFREFFNWFTTKETVTITDIKRQLSIGAVRAKSVVEMLESQDLIQKRARGGWTIRNSESIDGVLLSKLENLFVTEKPTKTTSDFVTPVKTNPKATTPQTPTTPSAAATSIQNQSNKKSGEFKMPAAPPKQQTPNSNLNTPLLTPNNSNNNNNIFSSFDFVDSDVGNSTNTTNTKKNNKSVSNRVNRVGAPIPEPIATTSNGENISEMISPKLQRKLAQFEFSNSQLPEIEPEQMSKKRKMSEPIKPIHQSIVKRTKLY